MCCNSEHLQPDRCHSICSCLSHWTMLCPAPWIGMLHLQTHQSFVAYIHLKAFVETTQLWCMLWNLVRSEAHCHLTVKYCRARAGRVNLAPLPLGACGWAGQLGAEVAEAGGAVRASGRG